MIMAAEEVVTVKILVAAITVAEEEIIAAVAEEIIVEAAEEGITGIITGILRNVINTRLT
jgi:hypothetical protein